MDNQDLVFVRHARSDDLSREEVLARLRNNARVDGAAVFGSRLALQHDPVSDFDLLILIESPPVNIFQLLTHIDRRMADIAFVSTADVDRAVSAGDPAGRTVVQRLFMLKMRNAHVVYDRSGRLSSAQHLARALDASQELTPPSSYASIYSAWFWENFTLLHVRRMAQSEDRVYQTAADMMLLTSLSGICRDYFVARSLPWEGEKAAVRYFEAHDPSFLEIFRECIACQDRLQKIALYERLIALVVKPRGQLWGAGVAAAFLDPPPQNQHDVEKALALWDSLIL